ncbi:MAG: acetate--CoA ligase family protein [Candidatus Sericytochromatia bacterium]|nr:acetate--CoA ligase family protein [Candidatus Sericytochromatia bacterium]
MSASSPEPLQPAGDAGLSPGYLAGMLERAWVTPLRWVSAPPSLARLRALDHPLAAGLPGADLPVQLGEEPAAAAIAWVGHWTRAILQVAGLPVFGRAQLLAPPPAASEPWWLLLPAYERTAEATAVALAWVAHLLSQVDAAGTQAATLSELPALLARLRAMAPHGANMVPFLAAAHAAGIPVYHVAGGVFQFGQGARARLLKSSFTDQTPVIAAEWARDKVQAAQALRRAGLPAPAHQLVANPEAAVAAAAALGYPVVLKPADRDGGVGVAAGLMTPAAVRAAFEAAAHHSARVLVEQHAAGRDYRLTVFQGELLWAIERQAGGVTGDGRQRVQELVEALNRDPRRGDGPHRPMAWLQLDAEALELLDEAGLTPASVPPAGGFVRLRRAANITRGGMPLPVMDRVHPDNRRLAIRAAAALRLDLAGVDLLIPDIARSWLEVGAAICEVNGQPELGTATNDRLHASVLRALVPGNGRIPVVVVVGQGVSDTHVPTIAAALTAAGHTVGRVQAGGVYIGDALVAPPSPASPMRGCEGATVLLAAPEVTAMVLAVEDASVLETGLPLARFDVLVVAGPLASDAASRQVLAVLLGACDGTAIPLAEAGIPLLAPSGPALTCWITGPVTADGVVAWVQAAVQEAIAHHALPPAGGTSHEAS